MENIKNEALDNANAPKKKFEIDFDLIKKANDLIKTISLKQKEYAPVNERVIAFRRVYPNGQIIAEPTFTDNYINFEALVFDDQEKLIAKGHAREFAKNEFAMEKAETSAIGRALGLCGFGISTSIASAEDMQEVDKPSQIFDEKPINELVSDFNSLYSKQEQIDLMNSLHVVDPVKIGSKLLTALIDYKNDTRK